MKIALSKQRKKKIDYKWLYKKGFYAVRFYTINKGNLLIESKNIFPPIKFLKLINWMQIYLFVAYVICFIDTKL